jgi:hypothetical protein
MHFALLQSAAFHQVPAHLSRESEKSSREAVWAEIKPRAGTMVGLPVFEKARSINVRYGFERAILTQPHLSLRDCIFLLPASRYVDVRKRELSNKRKETLIFTPLLLFIFA